VPPTKKEFSGSLFRALDNWDKGLDSRLKFDDTVVDNGALLAQRRIAPDIMS